MNEKIEKNVENETKLFQYIYIFENVIKESFYKSYFEESNKIKTTSYLVYQLEGIFK